MKDKLQNFILWLKEKKWYIAGGALLILLLILSLFIIKSQQRTSTPQPIQVKSPSSPSQPSSETKSPPQVSFSSYENKAPLPTVPTTVNGYTLKTNYSVDEAKEFGKKVGLTETKIPDDRFVILYNMSDMNNRGILTFDRVTGGLSFQSYGVHKTDSPNPEGPQDTARRFLTSLNLLDPTISCPITYERKGLTGVTYVECHRDWSLVGLPILNTVGILNVPEDKALKSLTVGGVDSSSPSDPSITSVSSSQADGKARSNDFNTITVGVTEDGRILSIESNMRKITETKQYTKDDFLSPEEALNQFISHKAQFSLTIPAGSGSVDWNKVYPDNQATGKKAVITDYLLTYLENPGQAPQERLIPMYIIRGTAELSSGYTVRFMETVPALKLGESTTYLAQSDSSLKLGTFQPEEETVTPTVLPSIPQPSVFLSPPAVPSRCNPNLNDLNPIYQTNGLFYGVGRPRLPIESRTGEFVGGAYFIYYIPAWSLSFDPGTSTNTPSGANTRLEEMNRLRSEIHQIQQQLSTINRSDPSIPSGIQLRERNATTVANEFFANVACPLRVTGSSPSVYLYPEKETEVKVSLGGPVSYSYPSFSSYPPYPSWEVLAKPSGELSVANGLQFTDYSRLYYEYDKSKVTFTEPNEGFIVERSKWEGFIRDTLAPQLGLTAQEKNDLVTDIKNALSNKVRPYVKDGPYVKDSPYLKISLVDRKELDDKLPLTISPKPDTFHRIHLLLTPLIDNISIH